MLTSLALLVTSGLPFQQDPTPKLQIQRTPASPEFAGTYHPATGLMPPQPTSHGRSGPDLLFETAPLFGYYSVPGADQEFIEEGKLHDRNHDHREQINGFEFSYCSTDPRPNGLSVNVVFYDESSYCSGPPDWPTSDCNYRLIGLPGGDPNGNLQCWTVDVDLCGFACDLTTDPAQNRLFGWSQIWDNSLTGSWLAGFGYGSNSSLTWFDTTAPNRNAAFLGCYWPFYAKNSIRMWGNPPEALEYSSAGGPGADDRLCITLDGEAQVGNTVVASVTDVGTPVDSLLWASPTRVDQDLFPIYGIDAHLLADHAQRVLTSRSATGDHTLTVPAAAGGGKTWYLQAATGRAGTPTAMSHGVELYVF